MKRPFLTIGLSMLCTMFLLFAIGTLYTLILTAVVLAVCAVIAFFRHREAAPFMLVGMAALIAVSSFSFTQNAQVQTAMLYCGENISVSGTLADYPEVTTDRFYYRLDDCVFSGQQTDLSLNLSTSVYYNCKPGDVLHFTAGEIYPSAEKDSKYYYSTMSEGVYIRAYTDSVQVQAYSGFRLRYAAVELRKNMLDAISSRLSRTHAGILSGLMLGNTDRMDTRTTLYFTMSGITHLFAVSGFHVSFWTGLLLQIFGRRKKHIIPSLFACAFLFFFMALTGFSVSVCRSTLMMAVIFLGNIFRKEADSLNSLGLAVALLLLQNPFCAADASLLLSAAATAAIILSSRPIEEYITVPLTKKIKHKSVRSVIMYISNLLCLSAAVTISLMPLTAFFFGSVSLLTPVANILCVPTAQGAMIVGMAAQLFNRIPYFSDFLFRLTQLLLDVLLFFAQKLASVPFAMLLLNTTATIAWIVASLLLIGGVYKKYNRLPRRAFFTALCSAAALLVMVNVFCFSEKDNATLAVLDTGNASCIALYDNSGNAAVIGCGGETYTVDNLSRQLRTAGIANPRLLLVPDNRETENANAYILSKALSPEQIVTTDPASVLTENVTVSNEISASLWKNAQLHFQNTENFRAAHININGKNIVICFYPSSDFSAADERYQNGDILICRQAIPPTLDPSRFKQIILSSDKEEKLYFFDEALAEKVITTADEGSIEISIR